LELKKSNTTTIQAFGPSADGIDHNRDIIYLWLSPKIDLAITSDTAVWTFADELAHIQYVYVGWLKNPSTMPPGVMQTLEHHGITVEDFPSILQENPFAGGSGRRPHVLGELFGNLPDPNRFQSLNFTFPYEPPYAPDDPVPRLTWNQTSSATATTGSSTQTEYGVKLIASGNISLTEKLKLTLKTEDEWKWTNASSESSSAGTTESATVTVGGPAFGYTGPTEMAVYYDLIYKTFLFHPVDYNSFAFSGLLTTAEGKAAPNQEISVIANGIEYRTFTNSKGEYRLYGNIRGPVVIRSTGVTKRISTLPTDGIVDLRLR
jgi:hypothetical protein